MEQLTAEDWGNAPLGDSLQLKEFSRVTIAQRVSIFEFLTMRVLSVEAECTLELLKEKLSSAEGELIPSLDNLQTRYLIDFVITLQGDRARKTYRLTPEGREALCEPTRSSYGSSHGRAQRLKREPEGAG